nr:ASCH domain-containing protein [Demequina iriomotensis]
MEGLPADRPAAWGFGATRTQADSLLELVLAGVKTGTASALWELEAEGESVPEAGELSILLDGAGMPQALIETTAVRIVPFDRVDAEHAASEGEGDRTLAHWREVHERFWRTYGRMTRAFTPDMPVVCERFRLLRVEAAPRP